MADLFRLRFEIAGVAQVDRVLGVLRDKIHDLTPAWEKIAENFAEANKTVFRQGGSSGEWEKWRPLNPRYAAYKFKRGWGRQILIRAGSLRLFDSLTDRSSSEFLYEPYPKFLLLGTKVPYAKYHQTGTRKMPKREVIRVTNKQRKEWIRIIQSYLLESGQFERAFISRTRHVK